MKFSIKKTGCNFIAQNGISIVFGPDSKSFNKDLQNSSKKNIILLNDFTNANINKEEANNNFVIKFPGTYEFGDVTIKVFQVYNKRPVENLININFEKSVDLTFINNPNALKEEINKNILEQIEETKLLVINFDSLDNTTNLLKELVNQIEPRFIIPFFASNSENNLEDKIIKIFGTNYLKTNKINLKQNIADEIKEKFIILN